MGWIWLIYLVISTSTDFWTTGLAKTQVAFKEKKKFPFDLLSSKQMFCFNPVYKESFGEARMDDKKKFNSKLSIK